MTLDELKSLRQGEVVVITTISTNINLYYDYKLGDELIFLEFNDHTNYFNFVRVDSGAPLVCHFGESISKYIERKIRVQREKKLTNLLNIKI